jgi:hypothetical protein
VRYAWPLLVIAACRASPAAEDEPAPAPRAIAPIGAGTIDVMVNGQKLAVLSASQLGAGVRLDELLANHPYVTWSSVSAYGPGAGPFEWLEPVTAFAGKVPVAFRDGDRGALALVDPATLDRRDVPERFDGIDEIHVTISKARRTPLESLAHGCAPPPKGELPEPAVARRWRGYSYQFNIPVHWRSDLTIDFASLVAQPVGTKVGAVTASAVEWEQVCHADLYRATDRNGRRTVIGRVRGGEGCVDAILEFACEGSTMKMWAYYASNGQYVEHGTIAPLP